MFSSFSLSFMALLCGSSGVFSLDVWPYCLFTFWPSIFHFLKPVFPLQLLLLKVKSECAHCGGVIFPQSLLVFLFATLDKLCNMTTIVMSSLRCFYLLARSKSFLKILQDLIGSWTVSTASCYFTLGFLMPLLYEFIYHFSSSSLPFHTKVQTWMWNLKTIIEKKLSHYDILGFRDSKGLVHLGQFTDYN